MARYFDTFSRHRKLLIAPLFVGAILSAVFALVQPPSATSSTRIWYDLTQALGSSTAATTNPYGTPAELQAQVFTELVNTRAFAQQVAARGPLGAYVRTPEGYLSAVDSLTAAKVQLKILAGGKPPIVAEGQAIDLAYGLISKNTTIVAVGPQIVLVTLHLRDVDITTRTLQAMVDQYSDVVLGDRKTQAQASVDFWKLQVDQQTEKVTASDAAVGKYLSDHAEQSRPNPPPDSSMSSLRNTQELDRQRYAAVFANLDQARLGLSASTTPAASGFRIIDPPRDLGLVTGLKKQLLVVAGGLIGSLFVSIAAVVALTLLDPNLRREEDVIALGFQVIGTVPRIPRMAEEEVLGHAAGG